MAYDVLAWKSADAQHTMMEFFNQHTIYIGLINTLVKLF